ncbi:hypothetical protein CBR_g34990 [Chara braunii]|uniref:Uncharacterized protein n=1 Tax=Chara braunii TaxID=69332 RepID=A0A388LJW0_CHABU|nr:hypothetical protein CBR_g34990 [Chara braunii]|eukprot:GBG82620.1 hypothetical protein CBR_g34990 [Chara braunii]
MEALLNAVRRNQREDPEAVRRCKERGKASSSSQVEDLDMAQGSKHEAADSRLTPTKLRRRLSENMGELRIQELEEHSLRRDGSTQQGQEATAIGKRSRQPVEGKATEREWAKYLIPLLFVATQEGVYTLAWTKTLTDSSAATRLPSQPIVNPPLPLEIVNTGSDIAVRNVPDIPTLRIFVERPGVRLKFFTPLIDARISQESLVRLVGSGLSLFPLDRLPKEDHPELSRIKIMGDIDASVLGNISTKLPKLRSLSSPAFYNRLTQSHVALGSQFRRLHSLIVMFVCYLLVVLNLLLTSLILAMLLRDKRAREKSSRPRTACQYPVHNTIDTE